jgi:hypothetical protein
VFTAFDGVWPLVGLALASATIVCWMTLLSHMTISYFDGQPLRAIVALQYTNCKGKLRVVVSSGQSNSSDGLAMFAAINQYSQAPSAWRLP